MCPFSRQHNSNFLRPHWPYRIVSFRSSQWWSGWCWWWCRGLATGFLAVAIAGRCRAAFFGRTDLYDSTDFYVFLVYSTIYYGYSPPSPAALNYSAFDRLLLLLLRLFLSISTLQFSCADDLNSFGAHSDTIL